MARRVAKCVDPGDLQGVQEKEFAAAVRAFLIITSSCRDTTMARQPRQEQGRQKRTRAVCTARSSRGDLAGPSEA